MLYSGVAELRSILQHKSTWSDPLRQIWQNKNCDERSNNAKDQDYCCRPREAANQLGLVGAKNKGQIRKRAGERGQDDADAGYIVGNRSVRGERRR